MDIKRYQERLKSSLSADSFLSLLLAEKTIDKNDVVALQTVPNEYKFDFLLKILQEKYKDNTENLSSILKTYSDQNNSLNVSRSAHLKTDSAQQMQGKGWTNKQVRPVSLYATFGSRPVTRSFANSSHRDQRPSSLRLKTRDREDIRFFFNKEENRPTDDQTNAQSKMASQSPEITQNSLDKKHESEYDRLRDQCMYAMNELDTLRRQHQEIVNRCDLSVKEADYHRKQHKATLVKYDHLVREIQVLRVQHDQAMNAKAKLQQDYEEIVLLREREKMEKQESVLFAGKCPSRSVSLLEEENSIISENGKLRDKNETLREELESLQADYALATSKLSESNEESTRATEQYESLAQEKQSLMIERDALRQQCTAAIREYEKALRDRDEAIKSSIKSEQQRKMAIEEGNMSYRVKYSHEISKIQEERNSALHEYKLVMSERDTVHREIEKLQDDLTNSQRTINTLSEEKEKIQHEAECLRQEINTVLIDRDQAVKESYSLKERLQDVSKDREHVLKKFEELRQDFEMRKQERDAARKERSEAISHRDKILKECFEVRKIFETSGENIEKNNQLLKRKFEALSTELTEAWREAEVALFRRDWAFGERNKIVRELQTLGDRCNGLAAERDKVAEECIKIQNKYDSFKVQHNKVLKELTGMKKYRDAAQTKDDRLEMLLSTDSAIDTESNEYELETLDLERTSKEEDFGFVIGGGIDSPLDPNDCSIFVTEIAQDGIAYGKLRVNDCLSKVNEAEFLNVTSEFANQVIQGTNFINLSVLRKRQCRPGTPFQRVKLIRTEDKDLGLSIDSGLHIKRIEPGSIASEDETLSIGDKILTINGSQLESLPYKEARMLLKRSIISLTILKASTSTASSHRSLANQVAEQDKESRSSDTRSCDTFSKSVTPFLVNRPNRTSTLPISISSRNPELPMSQHVRRHSMISGSSMSSQGKLSPEGTRRNTLSGGERKRFFKDLWSVDELLRPESLQMSKSSEGQLSDGGREDRMKNSIASLSPSSPPTQPHRSNSYMSAIVSQRLAQEFLPTSASNEAMIASDVSSSNHRIRPKSAPGSRQCVSNVNSVQSRHELLLQNGASPSGIHIKNRSDVSLGVVNQFSRDAHNLSKSVGRQVRRQRPHLPQFPSQGNKDTFFDKPYVTLPGSNRRSIDALERKHPDMFNGSLKSGSYVGRGHHKSTSSRASSTSSVSSGFTASHNMIKPRYEEWLNQTQKNNMREGDPRVVVIEKGIYPLGISIGEGVKGGIFVTMVNDNSVAAAAHLQCGDQLLEFNGINLRSATFEQAALILKQSADADAVTVLAQYNPHKLFKENDTANPNPQNESSQHLSRQIRTSANSSIISSQTKQNSVVSTITPTYEKQSEDIGEEDTAEEVRQVALLKPTASSPLGIGIIGGNAFGVFISKIEPESVASLQGGIRIGDRILEYNGVSFVNKTAEQATLELGKPIENIQMIIRYDYSGFRKVQEKSQDSFYVRALFDRAAHNKEELSFKKGDILYVTDTLYQGKLGMWKAWMVNENNELQKKEHGTIPSKTKAEQEVLLRRCSIYSDDKLKMRHSFFRRSKKGSHSYGASHSRESSDSRGDEAGSSIGSNTFANDGDLQAYQLVHRSDGHLLRPVVVLGSLAEPICDKLVMEWPYKFARSLPEMVKASRETVETDLEAGAYVDYSLSRRGTSFACITQTGIKEVLQKAKHCLLDINPSALERLLLSSLHPIIILLKYKSHKQIKDLRDGHYIRDKITSREAKELFESNLRMEKENKNMISAVINGATLTSICSQIIDRVQEEQERTLWVNV